MEQPELHASKLIVVQIPVHSVLLKQQRTDEPICKMRRNTHSERPYHKTISFVFAASLLQERHYQWPYPDNVCHHINKARHGKIIRDDGIAQRRTRRHPVPSLCTLRTIYHELRHGERVQTPKHGCSSLLEATLQKPEIKFGVFHELRTVLTSQIASKSLCQNMWTPMQRHNRRVGTGSINNLRQYGSLQSRIGAESAQHRHTNTSKSGPIPCPHQHSKFWSGLLKFNPFAFAQPNTREKMRGYIPFRMIDWNTAATSQSSWIRRHIKQEIPTNTSSPDHVTSMFTRLANKVNCDQSWWTSS